MNSPLSESEVVRRDTLVNRMLQSASGVFDIFSIHIGDRLGFYQALTSAGALTAAELAARVGAHERYVREWLSAQAASGFVDYDTEAGTFSLSPEMLTETPAEHRRHEQEDADANRRLAQQAARQAGLEFEVVDAEHDHLGAAVVQAAKARGCDLVVMPAHERHGLLGATSLDSETVRLLTRSEIPVLVLH